MQTEAGLILDALGGTSAVAKQIEAPVSTVHSWRTIGIPKSRMAHLKLLAEVKGITLPSSEAAA
ncbi:carph-isopro domain-containing protein [Sphingobium sp. DEHP117]|uniref:carph-isopro domain-containing protein n=1 Tax=Sphingobium sp. DEHP117 TaxID=2993436 RepID=UPI0035A0CA58